MGESSSASTKDDEQELKQFRNLLWGQNIRLDVFRRWSQGLFPNPPQRHWIFFYFTILYINLS